MRRRGLVWLRLLALFVFAQNPANANVDQPAQRENPVMFVNAVLSNEPESAERLLADLTNADYSRRTRSAVPVTLIIHVNSTLTTPRRIALQELADKWEWPHGNKVVKAQPRSAELTEAWLTAGDVPLPSDLLLLFEDNHRVSHLYFQYIQQLLTKYWPPNRLKHDQQLIGFSLSAMTSNELSHPPTPWQSHEALGDKLNVYLHSVPSSCALYFGDKWRDFFNFYSSRGNPPFYDVGEKTPSIHVGDVNLLVPEARSNYWGNSWRRFMVDFMYGRGYYLIYPNNRTFVVPVNQSKQSMAQSLPSPKSLPDLRQLPVFDLFYAPSSRQALRMVGDQFLERISNLGERYQNLAQKWLRPCMLDMVQQRSRQSATSKNKYLVYSPQMGFSNQLIALTHAAMWARASGRTLALPHILWPRAAVAVKRSNETWIDFADVFDPQGAEIVLAGFKFMHVSMGNIRTLAKGHRLILTERKPIFDVLQDSYINSFLTPNFSTVNLRHMLSGMNEVDIGAAVGTCSDEVLAFDGMYYLNPTSYPPVSFNKLWRALTKPNQRTAALIDQLTNKITHQNDKYLCMHVRLGDMSDVCKVVDGAKDSGKSIPSWLASKKAKGYTCSISEQMVLSVAQQASTKTILILSDQPEKIKSVIAGVTAKSIFTSADIARMVGSRTADLPTYLIEVLSAVVEQHVCARATDLWISGYSTFSNSIKTIREANTRAGVHYW